MVWMTGLSARAGVKRFNVVPRKRRIGRKPAMALKPAVKPMVSDLTCTSKIPAGYKELGRLQTYDLYTWPQICTAGFGMRGV
jgi:hypothetical protein